MADEFGDGFGVNTYSYTQSMTAAHCLRHLADKGVRDFELMAYPGHLWITDSKAVLADIRNVIEDNGLKLRSLNSPQIDLNNAGATDEVRALSLRMNLAFLGIAAELGAEGVIVGPGKANPLFPLPNEVLEGHFFAALDQLAPVAERLGVRIFIENMPFAFLPGADQVMASLDRYGNDKIQVCYDIANGHFIGEDPVKGLADCEPRLALVHLSDTTQTVFRHDAVGLGDVNFAPLPQALGNVGHDRAVLLEIISHEGDKDIGRSVVALRAQGF